MTARRVITTHEPILWGLPMEGAVHLRTDDVRDEWQRENMEDNLRADIFQRFALPMEISGTIENATINPAFLDFMRVRDAIMRMTVEYAPTVVYVRPEIHARLMEARAARTIFGRHKPTPHQVRKITYRRRL